MKNFILSTLCLFPLLLMAQQKEGIITYEEILKLDIQLPPEMQQYADMIPKEEKTNMDLFFTEKESLYSKSKKVDAAESDPFERGGANVQKVIIGGGGATSTYVNLEENTCLKSEDIMGKKFLINSDRQNIEWRVLSEQKVIAGYNCIKAEMKGDSTLLTAWFTPEIPVSVGPADFYGLPGAILFLESMENDRVNIVFMAKEVQLKKLDKPIEKPKKGKKVTEEAFEKIVARQMKEMGHMRGGSGANASGGNRPLV